MIEADALILHLNPLQEVLQAEGDFNWRGLLAKIEAVCRTLPIPVVAKEVGWGISGQVARALYNAGISAIDVAGAGGTSWSQVEMHRAPTERLRRLAAAFSDWGIPTAESLRMVYGVRAELGVGTKPIFASGGIRTGQEIAKCAALGADLVGLASPFLKRAVESAAAVVDEMEFLVAELQIAMFCSGAVNINALRQPGVLTYRGERSQDVER
jgi:isopentenyl-diphosphate delta-isomerase